MAATLCIGPEGDLNGVSPGECGVRLVKAGMYRMNKLQVQNTVHLNHFDTMYIGDKGQSEPVASCSLSVHCTDTKLHLIHCPKKNTKQVKTFA